MAAIICRVTPSGFDEEMLERAAMAIYMTYVCVCVCFNDEHDKNLQILSSGSCRQTAKWLQCKCKSVNMN